MAVLITQDCEGAGTPAGWTNTNTGTVDWDEATVVGEGSHSLRFVSSASNDRTQADFTAVSPAYLHIMWRWASLGGTADIARLASANSSRLILRTSDVGVLSVLNGTASASITDAVPVNTWVHLWARYVLGTGANGVADLAWSTTTTRPTSGTKFATLSTGTATTTVDRVFIGSNATETHTEYFDQIIVDDAGYPDVSVSAASITRQMVQFYYEGAS